MALLAKDTSELDPKKQH